MLTVATGYSVDYLLDQVAAGRENYYTGAVADGEPPGRWWGAGAEKLGLDGQVADQDMRAVFERFLDPRDEGFSDPTRWDGAATMGHTGRRYATEDELYAAAVEREPHATAERRDELRVQAGKDARQNVAFLDLTFSVQKSVTMLHTAFEAEEVKARRAGDVDGEAMWVGYREKVEEAIWAGNDAALTYLQDKAGYSRIGHHGGAAGRWVDAHDWTAASFFQHDSRDHDPQLHIHNPVVNRVQGPDGQWRTLDSRAIHRHRPAASAVGDRVVTERLMGDLGVRVASRPDGKAREVTAVPPTVMERHSSRRRAVTAKASELIADFEARHGREVNPVERDRLQRQATMLSRRAKSHEGESREQLLDRVDAQTRDEVAGGLAAVAQAFLDGRQDGAPAPEAWSPDAVLETALAAVQGKKASWTRADYIREIDSRLPDYLGVSDGNELGELFDRLADLGTSMATSLDHAVPGEATLPDELRLDNGASAYRAPGAGRYATPDHVRSENALRASSRNGGATSIAPSAADAFVEQLRSSGVDLGADQVAALRGVLTSGAQLETLVGPAGTGKSFVVGALARAWSDPTHRRADQPERRVFGLATSQIATEVLVGEGLAARNTRRWLDAQMRLAAGDSEHRLPTADDRVWRLHAGDLVVVDESSMADTAGLAAVQQYVEAAAAKLLLVGDHRQLAAVGAGGAMDLVASSGARYELTDARRFHTAWEGPASLRLRSGDQSVVADYHREGRLFDAGTVEQAEQSAAHAWLADTLGGRRSVLVVDTNDQAQRLSASLRAELVRLGLVEESGVALGRDGNQAGVGDLVQARRNGWELAGHEGNARGPINRETYRVVEARDDGSLVVAMTSPSAEQAPDLMVLPADYVGEDVALAYAGTVHSTQGLTVDTSHLVTTPSTSHAAAYVGLTRGRDANTAHVATTVVPEDAAEGSAAHAVRRDPRSVLAGVLAGADAADTAARSAVATDEDSALRARSVQTAGERLADAAHLIATDRTSRWLDALVAAGELERFARTRIAAEDGGPTLTRILRAAEVAGHDPREVLRGAVVDRPLDGARSVTNVVHGRITAEHTFDPAGDTWQTWRPRVDDPGWDAHLGELAEAADGRTRELGEQLVKQPPAWALDLLGPLPDEPDAVANWQRRGAQIASYRELQGLSDADAAGTGAELLGAAPGRGQVEAHAAYRAAWRAADLPEHDRDSLELSLGAHRVRVQAWEREQAWGPAYVDNLLAGTHQAAEQHRQTAQFRRAEAAGALEPDERARLDAEAVEAFALAEQLRGEVGRLEEVSNAYAEWSAETAMTRALADQSRAVLAMHEAGAEPEPRVTAEEWLAAERTARVDDDPHRDIADTDLRQHDQDSDDREHGANSDGGGADEKDKAARTAREPAEDDQRETDVPDVRDIAADEPRPGDEDTVRAVDHEETEAELSRARRAVVEVANRRELEQQHEQQERAEQLAHWQDDDQQSAMVEPDATSDETNDQDGY